MNAFWTTFKHSLYLPKRQAVFALNRVGMDIAVVYMFILLAIASIPGLVEQIITNNTETQLHTLFLLIFFFIFYYLIIVLIVFSVLSIIAYIGTLIANATRRKLRFGLLWKMAAFATTIPLLIFTVLSFFMPLSMIFLFLANVFIFFLMIKIIFIYPKRTRR